MIFSNGSDGPAIIVPLVGTTAEVLIDEARAAEAAGADVLEFRADFLLANHPDYDLNSAGREVLRELFKQTRVPILFTIRTRGQGGELDVTPFRYRVLMATVLDLMLQENFPAARVGVDFEYHWDATPELARRAFVLGYTPVVSHHEWADTPDDEVLYVMLDDMLAISGAIPKLAVMARDDSDTQRLLDITRLVTERHGRPVLTIAMGEAGQRSRLEGGAYGSVATFAAAGATTAPGQPSLDELRRHLERD
ncbi:type I 3-dehydroquinate dehydratase [Trueperella bialowiezensis]|uniref:3-dehydroquinate dehydratase n=1 Tax=Trueperella bialowiezensis TaxID=312285 RepID=A0A448PEZ9_9ACTO|nr:type I 3-dehydroquinate dehydratase [Trueperella bialowiezensis]VEI13496.1 3-dehydroquinate dehydratase [Trueperella bialowiezensis]